VALIAGVAATGFALQTTSPVPRVAASTKTLPTDNQRKGTSVAKPSPAVTADAAPAPRPTPEQMPAQPPHVEYINGLLSISANNSTLGDILNAIRARTGATFEAPGGLQERVAVHIGPAPPRQVIADLLQGSRYDYVLVGSDNDPNAVRSIAITVNNAGPASPAPAPPPQQAQTQNQPPEEEIPDTEAEGEQPAQPGPEQMRPMGHPPVPPGQMPPGQIAQPGQPGQPVIPGQQPAAYVGAQPGNTAQPGDQQRVKTPEELLQELQRMQQQQQQQQQQQR
jgi:hypothetical protein